MTAPILRYFETGHLPEPLRTVSEPFGRLARQLDESLPAGPELSTALRKLLEAKDAAVRAALDLSVTSVETPRMGEPNGGSGLGSVGAVVTEPGCSHPDCKLKHPHAGPAVLKARDAADEIVLPANTPQPG